MERIVFQLPENFLKQKPELHAFRYSMKPYVEQEQLTCYPLYAIQ